MSLDLKSEAREQPDTNLTASQLCIQLFKGMFISPTRTVRSLARVSTLIPGVAAAGLASIIMGFSAILLLKAAMSAIEDRLGFLAEMFLEEISEDINLGGVFFEVLVGFLILIAIDTGLFILLFATPWFRSSVDKKSVVNVVGFSSLYLAVALLIAFVLGQINGGLLIASLLTGVMLTYCARYLALSALGGPAGDRMYALVATHTFVYLIVVIIIGLAAVK